MESFDVRLQIGRDRELAIDSGRILLQDHHHDWKQLQQPISEQSTFLFITSNPL